MKTTQLIEGIKLLAKEMVSEKYQAERADKAKAIIDFTEIVERRVNGVDESTSNCNLASVSFSEASDCKFRSCNYNGTKRCTHPYCNKYEKGEAEVCQHKDTYKKVRFGVELERCKDCDSFWQT